MVKFETFKKAPITEAIVNINIDSNSDIDIDLYKNIGESLNENYSEIKPQYIITGEIAFPKDKNIVPPTPKQSTDINGFIFKNSTENKVIQSRKNGFSFHKLKPYENWTSFKNEARDVWNRYLEIAKPEKVNQLGLRYINNIEAPLPIADFDNYILTNPKIADGLPQSVTNFFMRLEIPFIEEGILAIIIHTMRPPKDRVLPLILDIDTIKTKVYTINDIDNIWEDFERLREIKNDIFFKSTSEKAKEMFR